MNEPVPECDPPAPTQSEPGICHYPTIAMTCSILAFFTFISTTELVWRWFPQAVDVYESVKVRVYPLHTFLYHYGIIPWFIVGIGIGWSLFRVLRKGTLGSTVVLSAATVLASLVLNWMCREAMWAPMINLLQPIGRSP